MKEKLSSFLCQQGYMSTMTSLPEFMVHFLPNIDNYVEKVEKNLKQFPFVNVAIISINVIIFILSAFMPELLYNKGAFSFKLIQETNEYYRFITSAFLHADTDHLLSNMLVLFFLGNSLESRLGHLRYVILYFLSAIGGNILSAIYEVNHGNLTMSVGASGAIFGVMAAVFVLIIVRGGQWNSISFSRMLLMILYSLYSGFVSENVNNAGHIGGFIVGLVIMFLYSIIERVQKKKEVSHEN